MRVLSEREESRELVLEVEAEPADMAKALEAARRRLAQRARVPGFRPGKAPQGLLERYLGREVLLEEAAREFAPQAAREALKARGVDPFAPPHYEHLRHEPIAFRLTVPLEPVVVLGEYKGLSLAVDPEPVTEEQVEQVLEQLAREQASWEPATAPARMGDLVSLDVEGAVEGRPVVSQKNVQYALRPDSPLPVPGFAQALEGMETGQERELSLPFPEDHPREDLRGKAGSFRVKVLEMRTRNPQPPGDDLAKSLGYADLAALREGVGERLRARADAEARRQLEEKVVQAVVEGARVEFSPLLVEREVERVIRERNLQDGEKLRQELRPFARRRLLRSLVLEQIAKAEGIEVSAEEVAAEVGRMSAGERGEEVRRFFDAEAARSTLRGTLLARKTVAHLVALATGRGAAEKG